MAEAIDRLTGDQASTTSKGAPVSLGARFRIATGPEADADPELQNAYRHYRLAKHLAETLNRNDPAVIGVITRKCVLRTLRENGPGTSRFDGSDGLLEGLVEGGFADFQASGGLTNGEARRNMRPSFTQLVGRDDGPAAALAAALACGT